MDCFQSQILICQTEFIDLFHHPLDQGQLSFLVQEEITSRIDAGMGKQLPPPRGRGRLCQYSRQAKSHRRMVTKQTSLSYLVPSTEEKKLERKRKNLISLGVDQDHAYA